MTSFRLPKRKDRSLKRPSTTNWKVNLILVLVAIQTLLMGWWWWSGMRPSQPGAPANTIVQQQPATTQILEPVPPSSPARQPAIQESTPVQTQPLRSYEDNPVRVQVLNGCGTRGLGSLVTDCLRSKGFDVRETGNASRYDYSRTQVLNRTSDQAAGRVVADSLGVASVAYSSDRSLVDIEVTVIIGKDHEKLHCP